MINGSENLSKDQLQTLTLKVLSKGADARLGRGQHYLRDALKKASPGAKIEVQDVHEVVWSLISQGLAYIDFWQPAPENWTLCLTEAGAAAAADEQYNPDDPAGYLHSLIKKVPDVSDLVIRYTTEAVHAYNQRLYLSSAVMLGVASEAAFLELGQALANYLDGQEAKNLSDTINNRRINFIAKFNEFRKRLESHCKELPEEFSGGLDLWLNSLADLLRINRNDAGHPTGRIIDREDCFINLRMFVRYLDKMYRLKAFLCRGV